MFMQISLSILTQFIVFCQYFPHVIFSFGNVFPTLTQYIKVLVVLTHYIKECLVSFNECVFLYIYRYKVFYIFLICSSFIYLSLHNHTYLYILVFKAVYSSQFHTLILLIFIFFSRTFIVYASPFVVLVFIHIYIYMF